MSSPQMKKDGMNGGRFQWVVRTGLVLTLLLGAALTSGCLSVPRHPSMTDARAQCGYVEFFHSSWLLGPDSNTVGGHMIYVGDRCLGGLFAPQYPWGCANFSLATSLWLQRVALPPGENDITVVIGNQRTPLRVNVSENRVTLVRLESEIIRQVGLTTYFKPLRVFTAATTLPKPENIRRVYADPASYDSLINLLKETDWGLRAYAVKRLKLLSDARATPHLEAAFSVENHAALKDELSQLIKRLKTE